MTTEIAELIEGAWINIALFLVGSVVARGRRAPRVSTAEFEGDVDKEQAATTTTRSRGLTRRLVVEDDESRGIPR